MYFRKYLKVAPLSLAIWRSLEAKAVDRFNLRPPILDIGCGFGEFAGVFFDNIVEVGIDIAENDLILAAKKKKYKKLVLADARSLPFKDSTFNTVVSISTLEHIKNVEKVFVEVFRILKPGGGFIFTVPTIHLNNLLFFPFLKRFWLQTFHWVFKHEIIIGRDEWLLIAKNAGFKIEYFNGTISKNQVLIFEFCLPFALPTQAFRLIFKKRLPISPKFRVEILYQLFNNLLQDRDLTEANIIVVAQKP